MVRTDEKVGKKRPFLRGLLLTAITFGIYGIYWKYQALQEVYLQFELDHEGRDDGVVWLVMGVVLPVTMLVYYWKAVGNMRYVRERLGLEPGIGQGAFVGLHVASRGLLLAAALAALGLAALGQGGPGAMVGLLLAAVLVSYGLLGYAYWRLQGEVNEVWDAWEDRVDELKDPDDEGEDPSPGSRDPGFEVAGGRSGPTG